MTPRPSRPLVRTLSWVAPLLGLVVFAVLVVRAGGFGGALPAAVQRSRAITFSLDEYRIVPETIHVRTGRVKLIAVNTGTLTHNLRIESYRNDAQGNPIVLGTTPTAHPGQTVFVKVRLGPGSYRLLCTIGDHADLGQRATLIAG